METPPDQATLHSVEPRFPPSDWLIGVRSEAQLSHLLEFGFTYISKEDEDCIGVQEDIIIPVVRENQGELVQFTGIRPPLFATEDDIRTSFEEYGIVMEVERENFDLPEDPDRPDEVASLEETMTMSWKVRMYRNEKHFPTMAVDDFPVYSRHQLQQCEPSELPYIDGYQSCHAIEIYGTPVPLRPATTFYLNHKEKVKSLAGSGAGPRASMVSLLGASLDSTEGDGRGVVPFTPPPQQRISSRTMPMTLASSGDEATTSLDPSSTAMVESMAAGLGMQVAAMAGSLSNVASSSGVMTQQERAAVLAELGRKAHAAIDQALQQQNR